MWIDCERSVIKFFSRLFGHMEEGEQCLELDNPTHMFSLQYVYQSRIQTVLQQWVVSWNSHPVAGCGNLSPLQMREAGFLQRFGHTHVIGTDPDVFHPTLPEQTSEEDYMVLTGQRRLLLMTTGSHNNHLLRRCRATRYLSVCHLNRLWQLFTKPTQMTVITIVA